MSRVITLSVAAGNDLEDIWAFTVETWSVAQAKRYLDGLDRVIRLLAEHPQIARERPEIGPGARVHPYRRHLILYSATDDRLFVSRIIHANADWNDWISG